MWTTAENGSDNRPTEVDMTSGEYVIVRRNITRAEEVQENNDTVFPAHYCWEEMKIPRAMWDVCRTVFDHESALDDVYEALTELAGMIEEGR